MTKILNPRNFKDPIAQKTEWKPILKESNRNFRIKRLSKAGETKLAFKAPAGSTAIYRNCALAGLAGLALMAFTQTGTLILWIVAVIAVLIGLWGIYLQSEPITFDKAAGVFKRGRKQTIKFDEIYALQLLSRIVDVKVPPKKGQKGQVNKINIYELNVVLNDGSRENVIAHAGLKEILEDSNTVSNFINKPIWDAIK
jgi:hypothetical protein